MRINHAKMTLGRFSPVRGKRSWKRGRSSFDFTYPMELGAGQIPPPKIFGQLCVEPMTATTQCKSEVPINRVIFNLTEIDVLML